MKKSRVLVAVLSVLCLIFILAGCSSESTPVSVAKDYLNAYAKLNVSSLDSLNIVSNEVVIDALMDDYTQGDVKTEEDFWKYITNRLDLDRENISKNYSQFKKNMAAMTAEQIELLYGEDYKIQTTVVSMVDMEQAEIAAYLNQLSDIYDEYGVIVSESANFSEITECKRINGKIYISSDYNSDIKEVVLIVANVDGEWKVLNANILSEMFDV